MRAFHRVNYSYSFPISVIQINKFCQHNLRFPIPNAVTKLWIVSFPKKRTSRCLSGLWKIRIEKHRNVYLRQITEAFYSNTSPSYFWNYPSGIFEFQFTTIDKEFYLCVYEYDKFSNISCLSCLLCMFDIWPARGRGAWRKMHLEDKIFFSSWDTVTCKQGLIVIKG